MTRCIGICNQKGGVGKSTIAVNLSYALTLQGRRVLLVDMDSQANATDTLGINEEDTVDRSIYDLFHDDERNTHRYIRQTEFGVDIIPSNISLATVESELVAATGRELYLRKRLATVADNYDYIILDASPSLGNVTYNVLVASSEIFIPTSLARYSSLGLTQLLESISQVVRHLGVYGANTRVTGVIANQYDARTGSAPVYYDLLLQRFGEDVVFKTYIPQNKAIENATDRRQPVIVYDKSSAGAKAFESLAQEVIAQEELLRLREAR